MESRKLPLTSIFEQFISKNLSLASIKSEQYNETCSNASDSFHGTQKGGSFPFDREERVV